MSSRQTLDRARLLRSGILKGLIKVCQHELLEKDSFRGPAKSDANMCTLRRSKNLNLLNLHAPNFVCSFQYLTIRTRYRNLKYFPANN